MIKKLFFAAIVMGTFFASAQTSFGVRAGVDFATVKVKYTEPFTGTTVTVSGTETGFFVGGFAEIGLSESFVVQPEVLYVAITESNLISMPILAKYSFSSFSILAGPDLNYLLDAEEDEFKVNVDVGAAYQITESIDVEARYSIGMGDVALSGLFVSAGYKF